MAEDTLKRLRRLYRNGKISHEAILTMLEQGKITEEEYLFIIDADEDND